MKNSQAAGRTGHRRGMGGRGKEMTAPWSDTKTQTHKRFAKVLLKSVNGEEEETRAPRLARQVLLAVSGGGRAARPSL